MIIRDLDFVCVVFNPEKTNAVLIIDPNTELAFPIPPKYFQSISTQFDQIFKAGRSRQTGQLYLRFYMEFRRQSIPGSLRYLAFSDLFGNGVFKGSDRHTLSHYTTSGYIAAISRQAAKRSLGEGKKTFSYHLPVVSKK